MKTMGRAISLWAVARGARRGLPRPSNLERQDMKVLDYMLEKNLYDYHFTQWGNREHYQSCVGKKGQINYRGEIFVLHHTHDYDDPYQMGALTPSIVPAVSITRIRTHERT